MQIVIKINDDYYNLIKRDADKGDYLNVLERAVINGTPLPKGHGRLIDADAYLIKERPRGIDEVIWKVCHIYKSITEAPTIIETDKEEN